MKKSILVLVISFTLIFWVFSSVHAEDTSEVINSEEFETIPENFTNAAYINESKESKTNNNGSEPLMYTCEAIEIDGPPSEIWGEESIKYTPRMFDEVEKDGMRRTESHTAPVVVLEESKSKKIENQTVKTDLGVSEQKFQILHVSETNEVILTSKTDGVEAVTKNNVEFSESKLYIVETTGKKNERYEVKVMPEVAKEAILKTEPQVVVKAMELKVADNKSVYEVFGAKKVKIFGFIPVSMEIKSTVDAETSEVVLVEEPWWGVFSVG